MTASSIRLNKLVFPVLLLIQMGTFIFSNRLSQAVNSTLFFLSSLFLGILPLFWYYKRPFFIKKNNPAFFKNNLIISGLGVCFLIYAFYRDHILFERIPIDPKSSDIIPTLQIFCQRFLHGETVYAPFTDFGYLLYANNLPTRWMPFIPAEYFGFDYRWIPLAIWLLSIILILYPLFKKVSPLIYSLGVVGLVFPFFYMSLPDSDVPAQSILVYTVEFLFVAYYLCFAAGIFYKNRAFVGLMLGICLLSRYSLIVWLPLFFFILWQHESKKQIFALLSSATLVVVLLYIIPFLSKDWGILLQGFQNYNHSGIGEWQHINATTGLPYHIFGGFGFAYVIYQHFPDLSLLEKFSLVKNIHLTAVLSTVAVLGVIYFKTKSFIPYSIFILASFKIYLAVFLYFIQVPYQYLMLMDLYLSIALLILLLYHSSPFQSSKIPCRIG